VAAIEAEGIVFSFGQTRALRGVSLRVERGESIAIFGPNGAGKTTFLKVLAALLRPEEGSVLIEGVDARTDPVGYRRLIGVISHQPYVYPQLTGRENLEFYARMHGLAEVKRVADRALDEMGLGGVADRAASAYSRGMLQRLAIGRALLHDPPVLLLDEPFTGLDHQARQKLEALLTDLRDGRRTVILTSHDIDAGLGLADRIAVLARGAMAFEARTPSLGPDDFVDRYMAVCAEATDVVTGGRGS
jgi:heme exporter protein A